MRSTRSIRRVAAMMLASVMVLAGVTSGSAKTLDLDEGFTLVGPGPTYWDFLNSSGCDTGTGFTPVDDGSFEDQSDAFDGGLVVAVDGTTFADGDGIVNLAGDGRTVRAQGTRVDGIQVSRVETVLDTSPTLRSVIRLRNTTGEAKRVTVMWDSNLGSDGDEEVRGSSSGDPNTFNLNDRWVISSDSASDPSDPVLTFALFGKGALVQTDDIVSVFGDGCFTVEYRVKVPPNSKRFLILFTRMNGTNVRAISTASDFDGVSAGDALLAGVPARVTSRTVNWNL